MNDFLEYVTIAAATAGGTLAAQGKKIDLFGVIVLGMVSAFGGGTLRDLCLDAQVFWIRDQSHVMTALVATIVTFFVAQRTSLPRRVLDYLDALGLALFAIQGTHKSILLGATPLASVALGTMTGVAGGILRDVMLNEVPGVFRPGRIYATAAVTGCSMYLLLYKLEAPTSVATLVGIFTILCIRVAAMHFELTLPEFAERKLPKSD